MEFLYGRKVDMSLNIKNPETHRMARELAQITGESVTGAVTEAVRERLDRVQKGAKRGLAERLLRIGADCTAHLPQSVRTINHGAMLYDEQGLPR